MAAGYLEPDDEADATEALIDGMAAVGQASPAWSDPGIYLDVETLLGCGARLDGDIRDFNDWLASLAAESRRLDRHSPEALEDIHRALYGPSSYA